MSDVHKFADHLPQYRQAKIFARAGLVIPRFTQAQWVGTCGIRLQPLIDSLRAFLLLPGVILTDETPKQMLAPGTKKTQRAYVWAYAPSPFAALRTVVQDKARSIIDALHSWMLGQRQEVPDGSAIAKALDCSLKRRVALVR